MITVVSFKCCKGVYHDLSPYFIKIYVKSYCHKNYLIFKIDNNLDCNTSQNPLNNKLIDYSKAFMIFCSLNDTIFSPILSIDGSPKRKGETSEL